jgi:hypothetical protein
MWELRRIDERLRCHGALWKTDAAFIKKLADHNENPSVNPRPEVTPKLRSAFIRQAEAHLVFGAYCEKERQRLAEKAHHLEQGTLDVAKDEAWRVSNEKIAHRAVEMEGDAVAAPAGEPDLFATPTSNIKDNPDD